MKILNLSQYSWENGGPAKIIYDHATEQLKAGHEVSILTPYHADTQFYPLPDGAKLIKCKAHWLGKFFPDFSPETWKFLKNELHKFDIVHIHGLWNFPGIYSLLANVSTKKLVTVHGTLGTYSLTKGKLKKQLFSLLFQKRAFKKADFVQVNHQDELTELTNYLGYQHPKAFILPNGIKQTDYVRFEKSADFLTQKGITADAPIVLFLGRVDAKKGIDLLLPAFKIVTEKHPTANLVIVGPDYGMKAFVDEFVEKNKLKNRVFLTGMLQGDEKLKMMANATLFTLPTYSEGFSIAVMEALSAGLPVVVSPNTGFSEVIAAYQAGEVVNLQPVAIAEGIVTLLKDDQKRQNAAQQATRLIKENYTIEAVAAQLLKQIGA